MSAMQKRAPDWVWIFEENLETNARWSECWGRAQVEKVLKSTCRTVALVQSAGLATPQLQAKADSTIAILTNRLIGYIRESK